MLTLKVITTDQDDQSTTYLFSGDSINHKESFSDDHSIISKTKEKNSTIWILGKMIDTTSKQKFTISDIEIYDLDRNLTHIMLVLPKSSCYIMDGGKTIDSFFCYYEKIEVK